MNEKKMNIKKLYDDVTIPLYANDFAAGADLYAHLDEDVKILAGETCLIGTGVAIEIPTNYAGFVFARSGLATREGLAPANCVGVIDSDYRGELKVSIHNYSNSEKTIEKGERIAQIVFMPYLKADFNLVDSLSETKRDKSSFGSTGKK